MDFHEVRLPARLSFGSTGGVERRTEVVTLGSGHERRNTPWAEGRRRYLIGANLRSLDDMAELTGFFEARRGRLFGFRFRDFADFKSCAPSDTPSAGDQLIGEGDGTRTSYPLVKAYGDVNRVIRKPVGTSVAVAVNGAALDLSSITLGRLLEHDAPRSQLTGLSGLVRRLLRCRRLSFGRRVHPGGEPVGRRLRLGLGSLVSGLNSVAFPPTCGAFQRSDSGG